VENSLISKFASLLSRWGKKLGEGCLERFGAQDGFGTITDSEETVSAREDELELARERGTVAKRNPQGPTGNSKVVAAVRNPIRC
jgi:hypothetical protein